MSIGMSASCLLLLSAVARAMARVRQWRGGCVLWLTCSGIMAGCFSVSLGVVHVVVVEMTWRLWCG